LREGNQDNGVFAGVGLPLVVVGFAMVTHAPNMILFTEGGSIRGDRTSGLAITVDDPALFANGDATFGMLATMAALQRGEVDVPSSAAPRSTGTATSIPPVFGDWSKPESFTYFAGSGGANDMATSGQAPCSPSCRRIRKSSSEKVDYLTTPGFLDGPGAREKLG